VQSQELEWETQYITRGLEKHHKKILESSRFKTLTYSCIVKGTLLEAMDELRRLMKERRGGSGAIQVLESFEETEYLEVLWLSGNRILELVATSVSPVPVHTAVRVIINNLSKIYGVRKLFKEKPWLTRDILTDLKLDMHTQGRFFTLKKRAIRENLWETVSEELAHVVAGKMLNALLCSLRKEIDVVGVSKNGKFQNVLIPSNNLGKDISKVFTRLIQFRPSVPPMIIPGKWTPLGCPHEHPLLNYDLINIRCNAQREFIKSMDIGCDHIKALNKLQSVPLRIDERLLGVLNRLVSLQKISGIDKLRMISDQVDLSKATGYELEKLKLQKGAISAHNNKVWVRRNLLFNILQLAEEYKGKDLYFTYRCDMTGRIHCVQTLISPQASELGKYILRFSKSLKRTERGLYWKRIELGKLFGIKGSLEELHRWYKENSDWLKRCSEDPIENMEWCKAKKPWALLALLLEPDTESYRPIGLDGACNGVQHYAALMQCRNTGKLVGFTDNPVPFDLYSVLQGNVRKNITDLIYLDNILSRDLIKGLILRVVFKAVMLTRLDLIKEALREHGIQDYNICRRVDEELFKSISELAPGLLKGQEFLLGLVKKKKNWITWDTQTGFKAFQPYVETEVKRVQLKLSSSITLRVKKSLGSPDMRKQRVAFVPNYIHSMDAQHVARVIVKFKESMFQVFDEYLTYAEHKDLLMKVTRDEFVEMYKLPQDMGESIKKSQWFFM